ncbi:hypothetical protein ACWCPQ_26830 [Nocardia sp. NPDC001965]
MDVVFGLTQSGWEREVTRKVDPVTGKEIRVDFYLREDDPTLTVAENNETKTGALNKGRDVGQLRGYEALLRRGETVRLYTRAEKDQEMAKEARALLSALKARFPDTFIHKSMNEKVYGRIMEAGARALERENRQELAANLGRLPEREARGLSITEIARAYAREAPTAGIEQLRLMARELRELALTQGIAERDIAEEDRNGLGLRFQAAKSLEQEQKTQLTEQDAERHAAVDQITYTLTQRERELIDRGSQEAARELQQQLDAGRINLEQTRESFQGLAYALGKNQELERRTEREAAARSPGDSEQLAGQLREQEAARQEKDREVSRQIGAIGAVVENETALRQRAELSRLATEVNRERLIARGVEPEKARLQAPAMPAPVLRDSDRGRDPKDLARELPQRDRAEAAARRTAMDDRVAALVARGVPVDAAEASVLARLSSPADDLRSIRDREVQQVESRLIARGVPPEIARAAAEGRMAEPPQVTRAHAAEDRARERTRDFRRER